MTKTRVAALAAASLILPLAAIAPSAAAAGARVTAATAAAAEPPYSGIATVETTGAQATAPGAMSWQAPTSTIGFTAPTAESLEFTAGDAVKVTITADSGSPAWTAGSYQLGAASNTGDGNPTARFKTAAFDISSVNATFDIVDLQRNEAGVITAISADVVGAFTEGSGGHTANRRISLRFNHTSPYTGLDSTGSVALGSVKLAYPTPTKAVTVTVDGPTAVSFGTSAIIQRTTTNTKPIATKIVADTCKGATVAPGGTCTVTVQARPQAVGLHDELIQLKDSSGTVRFGVRASVTGIVDQAGRYNPVTPKRAHDSRISGGRMGPGADRVIKVAGVSAIPAGARAVVVNVTAVSPTSDGYLAVHTAPGIPTVSHVNFKRGVTRANLVTTPMAADGTIRVYNRQGYTHLIVDVVGWVNQGTSTGNGSQMVTEEPQRVLDTRASGSVAFHPYEEWDLDLSFEDPSDNASVTGLVVNLTAVSPTAAGHLLVWNGASAAPTVSNLNFAKGMTVPGLAFVPTRQTAAGFTFKIRNGSSGYTHVLVDVVGYFDKDSVEGLRFVNAPSTRVLDTRNGTGGVTVGQIGAAGTRKVTLPKAAWNVTDTYALMTNVTAAWPTKATHDIVWAGHAGTTRPTVSNLNPVAGDLVSNAVVTEIAGDWPSTFSVYNNAGSTHLITDVMGVWNFYPGADAFPDLASPKAGLTASSETPTAGERLADERTFLVRSTRD